MCRPLRGLCRLREREQISRLRLAPLRPSFHHRPALFQRVARAVGRLRLVPIVCASAVLTPTDVPLVSWAGMCPRLDESAGRKRSRRLRKGAPWLKPVLVQAALAAISVTNSSLRARYLSLKPRLGHKKAIIAVAAAILRIVYHMLKDGTFYDLGPDYRRPPNPERAALKLASRIRSLGFEVDIKKAA